MNICDFEHQSGIKTVSEMIENDHRCVFLLVFGCLHSCKYLKNLFLASTKGC